MALGHAASRLLLHTLPELRKKIDDDSIVITSHINSFIDDGRIFNVVKSSKTEIMYQSIYYQHHCSGYQTWFYGSELVYYNGQAWPTTFTAMSVARWRNITSNSSSCQDLVAKHDILKYFYQPDSDNAGGNIDRGIKAVENFVTHRKVHHSTINIE